MLGVDEEADLVEQEVRLPMRMDRLDHEAAAGSDRHVFIEDQDRFLGAELGRPAAETVSIRAPMPASVIGWRLFSIARAEVGSSSSVPARNLVNPTSWARTLPSLRPST